MRTYDLHIYKKAYLVGYCDFVSASVFEYLINGYRDCKEFVCVTKSIRVAK